MTKRLLGAAGFFLCVTSLALSTPPASAPAPGGPAAEARQAKGLAGVGLTAEQVNRAIEKGRKFLWEGPLSGGKEDLGGGDDLLASLALVHAGAHKVFPAFDKALRKRLRSWSVAEGVGMTTNYECGVVAMLVEAYGDPEFHYLLHSAVRYHVEAQGPKGAFDYKPAQFEPIQKLLVEIEKARKSEEEGEAITVTGAQPLDLGGAGAATTRMTPRGVGSDGDNSVTQFALLGLWSGQRSGLRIDPDVWRRALDITLKRQTKAGGWAYAEVDAKPYGSMTCAGLCAIVLCKHHLGLDYKNDPAMARGLAWLDKNWSVDSNPGGDGNHLYSLYSIERLGRILDTEFIGSHEWYPLIARQLVKSQKPNGEWEEAGAGPHRSCSFALLALTRATPSLQIPVPLGGEGTLLAKTSQGPQKKVFFLLDASSSMLANGGNFDRARGAVHTLLGSVPDKTPVALRVFGHTRSAFDETPIDSAMEVAPGPIDRDNFTSKLSALCARGAATLGANIAQASADLKAAKVSPADPAILIVLSDGVEAADAATRAAPAAEALAELKGLSVCALALDTGRPDDAAVMRQVAQSSGGQCWGLDKLDELSKHLAGELKRAPDGYLVLDAAGRPIEGAFGQPLILKEGKYTFKTQFGGKSYQKDLWINTNVTTAVTVTLGQ